MVINEPLENENWDETDDVDDDDDDCVVVVIWRWHCI